MIYGIIVFGLRKGSRIHRKGFRMFPEMFGYENTLFGPKGKAHKVFGKRKRKFCGVQGPAAKVQTPVKEHAVPPCLVLVIDDNLYGLMVALSYI